VLDVRTLELDDRPAWELLFRGYIDFYQREAPQEMYDRVGREFQAGDPL
jgi:hypothetical protein